MNKQVINKAIYLVLGVNMEGYKELLGMWLSWICPLEYYENWARQPVCLIGAESEPPSTANDEND